jgi:hypothetical protein
LKEYQISESGHKAAAGVHVGLWERLPQQRKRIHALPARMRVCFIFFPPRAHIACLYVWVYFLAPPAAVGARSHQKVRGREEVCNLNKRVCGVGLDNYK